MKAGGKEGRRGNKEKGEKKGGGRLMLVLVNKLIRTSYQVGGMK